MFRAVSAGTARTLRVLLSDTRGIFFSRKENAPYETPKKRPVCRLDNVCNRLLQILGYCRYPVSQRRPLSLPRCISGHYNANPQIAAATASAAIDAECIVHCPLQAVTDCTQRQVRTKPFSFGCPEGYFLFAKRKYPFGFDGRGKAAAAVLCARGRIACKKRFSRVRQRRRFRSLPARH